jgi:zinc protease
MDKERGVILEELKMSKDYPADYLSEKLFRAAFTKHRYGRPIIGFEESLEKMTPEDLKGYYNNFYRPNNTFLLAVGDIDSMDVLRRIERTYRKLKEGKITRNPSPKEPPQRETRRFEMEGNILTGHLQMAFHIPSVFEKDVYACTLLASILGEGKSSRLYRELREKRKIVSRISAYSYTQKDPGVIIVEAEMQPEHLPEAEAVILSIIKDLADNGFTEEEFIRAKNMNESSYIYGQETVEGQGRKIGFAEIKGDYMLVEKFVRRLVSVDPDEARAAASKYLTPENCTIGIYKPAK